MMPSLDWHDLDTFEPGAFYRHMESGETPITTMAARECNEGKAMVAASTLWQADALLLVVSEPDDWHPAEVAEKRRHV